MLISFKLITKHRMLTIAGMPNTMPTPRLAGLLNILKTPSQTLENAARFASVGNDASR